MKPRNPKWTPEYDPQGPPDNTPELDDQPFEGEPETFVTMRRIEYLGRIHHMAFGSVLQKDGLPPAQVGAIKVIIRSPGMSQRELADELHIQRATATVMLQKMERAGFVDRRPDPQDQRISRIYPTRAAVTLDDENRKAVDTYFEKCFRDFSPEDFHLLDGVLTRLSSNIRAILAETSEAPSKE